MIQVTASYFRGSLYNVWWIIHIWDQRISSKRQMEHQYTHLLFTLGSLFLFLPVFRQWTGWDPEAVKSPGTLHQPTPGLRVPDNATWRHVSGVWSCGEAFHTNHLPVQWKHRCLQGMCTNIAFWDRPYFMVVWVYENSEFKFLNSEKCLNSEKIRIFKSWKILKFKDLCWWGSGEFLASSIKTRKENLNILIFLSL